MELVRIPEGVGGIGRNLFRTNQVGLTRISPRVGRISLYSFWSRICGFSRSSFGIEWEWSELLLMLVEFFLEVSMSGQNFFEIKREWILFLIKN